MASLADELSLDPDFDDTNADQDRRGVPMSFEEELEVALTPGSSPKANRRRKQSARANRGRRGSSESAEGGVHSRGGMQAEGFSLADELGSSSSFVPQVGRKVSHKASYSNGVISNDEDNESSFDSIDQSAQERKNQEHYLASTEILDDSLRHTEDFLIDLQYACTGGAAVARGQSLPSAASQSTINGGDYAIAEMGSLEERAASLLKQMREQTSKREEQIRELQECDRILNRAFDEGGDWLVALAHVDDWSDRHSQNEAKDPNAVSNSSMPNGYSTNDKTFSTSLADHVNLLQHSTVDLVAALGSIHEQGQVAQASMNDAARRIRTIKTVLGTWSTEVKKTEQSRAHITAWESQSDHSQQSTREWTRGQMEKVEWILEDAEVKARQLLSQVKDPVLDALAARGWEVDQRRK